jgi:IS5 family transposase
MDAVIPRRRLLALIEPHYAKTGQGRPPLGLAKRLRLYFLQQWFKRSDPPAEDALYDSESRRRSRAWSWVADETRWCVFAGCRNGMN